MWVHGSTTEEKETSPNVKMKMNEEEGPGEHDHTEELVKAWKVAVLGNLLMQHSREKQKTRLPNFTANINVTQNITIFKTLTQIVSYTVLAW